MKSTLKKRLDRLARPQGERLRVVTVYPGEAMPTAAQGELLVIIKKFCRPEALQ